MSETEASRLSDHLLDQDDATPFCGGPVKPEDSLPLLPCPFCGSHNVDPAGWASHEDHGPACDDCGGSAQTVALWNNRPVWSTPLASLGDSRSERVGRLAQQKLPLCNDGWELE